MRLWKKKRKESTIFLIWVLIGALVAGVIWRGRSKKPQIQGMSIETAQIRKWI